MSPCPPRLATWRGASPRLSTARTSEGSARRRRRTGSMAPYEMGGTCCRRGATNTSLHCVLHVHLDMACSVLKMYLGAGLGSCTRRRTEGSRPVQLPRVVHDHLVLGRLTKQAQQTRDNGVRIWEAAGLEARVEREGAPAARAQSHFERAEARGRAPRRRCAPSARDPAPRSCAPTALDPGGFAAGGTRHFVRRGTATGAVGNRGVGDHRNRAVER